MTFKDSFPLTRVSRSKAKNKPWFDKACNKAFKKKSKLYKKYQANPIEENETRYKNFNKYYKILIRKAKDKYDNMLLDACGNNPKESWKVINKLLGKTKQKEAIYIKKDNDIVTDPFTVANTFNEQFNKVGKLFGASPTQANHHLKYMAKKESTNFHFEEITLEETQRTIFPLNCTKQVMMKYL